MGNTKRRKVINRSFNDCCDCPYFLIFDYSSELWCNLSDKELLESPPEDGNMVINIPDWCELEDSIDD